MNSDYHESSYSGSTHCGSTHCGSTIVGWVIKDATLIRGKITLEEGRITSWWLITLHSICHYTCIVYNWLCIVDNHLSVLATSSHSLENRGVGAVIAWMSWAIVCIWKRDCSWLVGIKALFSFQVSNYQYKLLGTLGGRSPTRRWPASDSFTNTILPQIPSTSYSSYIPYILYILYTRLFLMVSYLGNSMQKTSWINIIVESVVSRLCILSMHTISPNLSLYIIIAQCIHVIPQVHWKEICYVISQHWRLLLYAVMRFRDVLLEDV